jgi:hypothetical protein
MSKALIGQTAYAAMNGRPVPIEVVKADDTIVQWRSLDLQHAGSMTASRWTEMRDRQQAAMEEENAIRAKALRAAEALYGQMERIDGEEMDRAQCEQDPEAGRHTWTREVARIIAAEFGVHDA